VFYVNLPVGLLSLLFVGLYLPHLRHSDPAKTMRLDWPGALLITTALGCLQLFVELLPKHGISTGTTLLLVISLAAVAAIWFWERRCAQPLLPFEMFRDPKLGPLFTLSVVGGFAMFSVLFFAPLLLQGGFGLSPQDAGVLITPLVVFITIGSIANGRIVTRLRNPNAMLTVGFVLLAICCAGVAVSTRTMPRALLMVFMLCGGLGLGFIFPNLTIFAQQAAGRQNLGIATALLQSLRMIGGMAGAALTGTLVTHRYTSGVKSGLSADHALPWLAQLADPQILINHAAQGPLMAQLAAAGHDGARLLELARLALVSAIHMGVGLGVVIAVFGVWHVRRLPLVTLHTHHKPSPETLVHGE